MNEEELTKITKELAIKFETDEEIVRLVLVRMGALTRKNDKNIKFKNRHIGKKTAKM